MTFLEIFFFSISVGITIGAAFAYLKQRKDMEQYFEDDVQFWKGGSGF
ncbi:MAG: hypothetical protein ACTTI6_07355 [Treponema sp.]